MMEIEGLIEAYRICRKNKRGSEGALAFEVNYESDLVDLCDEVNDRSYRLSTSRAFIVPKPVYREVFAPAFRDRIIDTYIAIRVDPLLEKVFTNRTFNCRKEKGALYGIKTLYADIRECSKGYSSDCYIMKLDIKGFFMSIPKSLLAERIDELIIEHYEGDDKEDLRFLCRTAIMHNPEMDCERRSPIWMWSRVPANKSLFTNGSEKGMAIGRIVAQLFANFFLNPLDHWIEEELGFPFHGRYVDDFYIICEEKGRLLNAISVIRKKLNKDFRISLHPNKVYIQHYSKGVKFTGAVAKPGRIYIANRTVAGLRRTIYKFNQMDPSVEDAEKARHLISSLNSYYGLMTHTSSYAIRRRYAGLLEPHCWKYFYIEGHFKKFVLKKKYTEKTEIINIIEQEKEKYEKKRKKKGKDGENDKKSRKRRKGFCRHPNKENRQQAY